MSLGHPEPSTPASRIASIDDRLALTLLTTEHWGLLSARSLVCGGCPRSGDLTSLFGHGLRRTRCPVHARTKLSATTPRMRTIRWWVAGSLVLALAACGGTPSGVGSTTALTPAPSPTRPTSTPDESSSDRPDIAERASVELTVHGGPDFPTEGFGSLWFLAPDSEQPSLVRVDPASNETVATIPLPDRLCQGFAITDEAVWVCTASGAARINPESNEIDGDIEFDTGQFAGRWATDGRTVWALGSDAVAPNTLVQINPGTDSADVTDLGRTVAAIAYGFDALWLTAPDDGLLLRVDPETGETTEHSTGLQGPWSLAAGSDSLWLTLFGPEEPVPSATDPTVARIDPETGHVLAEIATGATSGSSGGLVAADDGVWVRAPDLFLTHIDPRTNEIVRTVAGPGSSGDVAVAFGSVWATAVERNRVYRLEP